MLETGIATIMLQPRSVLGLQHLLLLNVMIFRWMTFSIPLDGLTDWFHNFYVYINVAEVS